MGLFSVNGRLIYMGVRGFHSREQEGLFSIIFILIYMGFGVPSFPGSRMDYVL